jgi:hypothetical protein
MSERTCSISGCCKPIKNKRDALCAMHYWRLCNWGHVGSPEPERKPRGSVECIIAGCTRPTRRNGLCNAHSARAARFGEPGDATIQSYRTYLYVCHIEDCDNPQRSSIGLCGMHARRYAMWGDPYWTDFARGEDSSLWKGDDVGYSGAHSRVRRAYGLPSLHRCVDCGGQAEDWAYDHLDDGEQYEHGWPYSTNPDHYMPMCKRCHVAFDRALGVPHAKSSGNV